MLSGLICAKKLVELKAHKVNSIANRFAERTQKEEIVSKSACLYVCK